MTIARRGLKVKVIDQCQGQVNAVGPTSIEDSFSSLVTFLFLMIDLGAKSPRPVPDRSSGKFQYW